MFPHEGVVHYNSSTGPHPHPSISLQIVDLSHQHETNDVQIGQNLELQIVAEYSPHQLAEHMELQLAPLPDFRATSLVAKTADNENYVLLIDEAGMSHGCQCVSRFGKGSLGHQKYAASPLSCLQILGNRKRELRCKDPVLRRAVLGQQLC